MKAWICMIGFDWAFSPINRCSKPSHPNCGWFRMVPIPPEIETVDLPEKKES